MSEAHRVKLAWWRKVLYALVAVALFFAGFELILHLAGIEPLLHDDDPYVGFSARIPLFVEKSGDDGGAVLVTAENKLKYFNPQEFPRRKASGTYRIFCVGGSTTFGRPYDDATSFCGWLREFLPAADPSRHWEVINAGGISYASYRVSLLMEELVRYEPDLFIVYSGHNEFLERRTYSRLIEMPASVRGLGALLSATRTYSWVHGLLRASPGEAHGGTGARDELPGEVDTILDNSVGPEAYRRDDQHRQQVIDHFRFNLLRMAAIARAAGAAMLLVTPASNLGDCAPFKSENGRDLTPATLDRWRVQISAARQAFRDGRHEEALSLVDRALSLDARHAETHYLRGRVLASLERHGDAVAAFERSLAEDVCPLRALPAMTAAVLEVAASRDLPCVDFAAIVKARSAHGIPGEDQFLDHVHPTIEGHRILALSILDLLSSRGIVERASTWDDAAVEGIVRRVESGIDRRAHGKALSNLSQVLNWAGKVEESGKLALKAVEMVPDDATASYLAGREFERRGDLGKAAACYEGAIRLDPKSFRAHNDLGLLLAKQGDLAAACERFQEAVRIAPEFVPAYHNLGLALEKQQKLEPAAACYERLVEIRPDSAEAHHDLAQVLAKQGKIAAAIRSYERAIRVAPEFARAHHNLGIVLARVGRMAQAAACFERAVSIEPGYDAARRSLERARLFLEKEE